MGEAALWATVVASGAVGSVVRYVVDTLVGRLRVVRDRIAPFPAGTLLINVSGSFLLGLVTGLVLFSGADADWRTVLGTGFCGGYTTFSTASFESVRLAQERRYAYAGLNLAANLGLGLAAAAAGLALGGV